MTARLIAVEGIDASGKSTQARRLASAIDALATREPGGTRIGEEIRRIVLDPVFEELGHRTEALLYAAARAQHVEEVIAPTLAAGRHVVTDRYLHSSVVYQGVGRGLGADAVLELNEWATARLEPDLVVLLDVPVASARVRLGDDLDRLEQAGPELQEQVRAAFLALARNSADRWVVVDGTDDMDAVAVAVRAAVRDRLGL